MYTQIYIHMYTQNQINRYCKEHCYLYSLYTIQGVQKKSADFFRFLSSLWSLSLSAGAHTFLLLFFFVKKVKGKKLLHCSLDGCVLRSPVGKWDFLFMSFCFFSYSISSSKLDFRMIRLKDIAQVKKHATSKASYNQSSSQYLPCWSVSESYLLSSTTYTYYTKSGRKIKFLKKAF